MEKKSQENTDNSLIFPKIKETLEKIIEINSNGISIRKYTQENRNILKLLKLLKKLKKPRRKQENTEITEIHGSKRRKRTNQKKMRMKMRVKTEGLLLEIVVPLSTCWRGTTTTALESISSDESCS